MRILGLCEGRNASAPKPLLKAHVRLSRLTSNRQLPLSRYCGLTHTTTQYALSIAAAIALRVDPLIAGAYREPSSSRQTWAHREKQGVKVPALDQ